MREHQDLDHRVLTEIQVRQVQLDQQDHQEMLVLQDHREML